MLTRKNLGRRLTALLLTLTAPLGACTDTTTPFTPTPPPERPNVVLVVIDTLRADRCGFQGYERPTTPFLDELARESVTFRQCWSPANWTGPAHATLFTGLRPAHHGFNSGTRLFLAERFTTLAESLRDVGYRTGCFTGNVFIGPDFGTAQGFQAYRCTVQDARAADTRASDTLEAAADWALDPAHEGKPSFLFVNLIEPHAPYAPDDEFADRFVRPCTPRERARAGTVRHPATMAYSAGAELFSKRELGIASDLYDAEVAAADAALATFFERLRAAGTLDDTLVIVTSDHGENLGEKHLLEHVFSMHRTLLHVPLIVRFPYLFEPGRLEDEVVRLEDVAPTVLEICGARAAHALDGASLLSPLGDRLARGSYGRPGDAVTQVERTFGLTGLDHLRVETRSVFDGRHHLIRTSAGREELYDLSSDPREQVDLAGRERAVAERLRALLDPFGQSAMPLRER